MWISEEKIRSWPTVVYSIEQASCTCTKSTDWTENAICLTDLQHPNGSKTEIRISHTKHPKQTPVFFLCEFKSKTNQDGTWMTIRHITHEPLTLLQTVFKIDLYRNGRLLLSFRYTLCPLKLPDMDQIIMTPKIVRIVFPQSFFKPSFWNLSPKQCTARSHKARRYFLANLKKWCQHGYRLQPSFDGGTKRVQSDLAQPWWCVCHRRCVYNIEPLLYDWANNGY